MDLVPKPEQVLAAAANVLHRVRKGGLADLRPMPRGVVAEGERHRVLHLEPDPAVARRGEPVLLVPPLGVPVGCFDLRRGCSLAEHLIAGGRPSYVVELHPADFRDPDLTADPWVTEVLPAAVRTASQHAGGRPVHVVGWSLGGTFALLAAARDSDLPIASVTALGAPVDVTTVPMQAPVRPLVSATDWTGPVGVASRVVGSAPAVRWAFGLDAVQQLVARPAAVGAHLDDADWLAQLEAVDRLSTATAPYRGRGFGRLHHRFAGAPVELADLTAPTLVVAGAADTIAPVAAVRAAVPLLTGAREVRFEIVPGGHLGLLTGRGARAGTWPVLDEWFEQWDDDGTPPGTIGANPRRRHTSAGSRALNR